MLHFYVEIGSAQHKIPVDYKGFSTEAKVIFAKPNKSINRDGYK